MMMNIFALASNGDATNTFSQAGIVALMGMGTIFIVLALLWGAVEIMHRVLHRGDKKEAPAKDPAPVPTILSEPVADDAVVLTASGDDGAIVAAITVAITAMREEQGCDGTFRVVSFRRVGGKASRRRV